MALRRKKERVRLIDDDALAISRDRSRNADRKPDAWFRSDPHLAYVRSLPCCDEGHFCGGEVEAAHVRIGTDGCAGEKPSDYFTLPLCKRAHKMQHVIGERSFHRLYTRFEDPAREALKIALGSRCPRTRDAAQREWERRGYA